MTAETAAALAARSTVAALATGAGCRHVLRGSRRSDFAAGAAGLPVAAVGTPALVVKARAVVELKFAMNSRPVASVAPATGKLDPESKGDPGSGVSEAVVALTRNPAKSVPLFPPL